MRSVVALVLGPVLVVAGCGSGLWRAARVDELPSGSHILVITTDRAYELDDIRVSDGTVTGYVLAAWIPTRIHAAYLQETDDDLRRGDEPARVASVLGWQRAPLSERTVAASVRDIRYARVYDPRIGGRVASTIGGFLLSIVLLAPVVIGIVGLPKF